MGRDSDRIAELKREIDANPHSRQFYQLGELLRRDGRAEEAVAVLKRGLQYWPKYVAAWVSLGRAELERGAADGAIAALERAIELDPENPVAWRLLAEGREIAGDVERALAAMRRAAGLVPGDETLTQVVERLEALALAAPPPPGPAPLEGGQRKPEELGSEEGAEAEVEETAVMPAGIPPLPEPLATPTPKEESPPVGDIPPAWAEQEKAADGGTAEVFALVEPAPLPEAAPGPAIFPAAEAEAPLTPGPFVELETVPSPLSAPATAQPQGATAVPCEDRVKPEALPSPLPAAAPTAAVAALEEGAGAQPPAPFAPPPVAELQGALEDPFAGSLSQPEAPAVGSAAAPEEVFALNLPAPAGGLEDVFGAAPPPQERAEPGGAPPPLEETEAAAVVAAALIEPVALPPAVEPPPLPESEPAAPPKALEPPLAEDSAPWVTQARLVVPILPPAPAETPPPAAAPPVAAGGEPAAEAEAPTSAVLELAGESAKTPWPAAAFEAAAPEPEPSWPAPPMELREPVAAPEPAPPAVPAAPAASVEAARALIRAEQHAAAAAMLEQVVDDQPGNLEARELLELVRDMLEPMPMELPPLSPRQRKIAALQRWLASLTLARERAAL